MAKKLKENLERARVLSNEWFSNDEYEYDDTFKPANSIKEAHTISEMVKFAESDPTIQIEGRIISKDGKVKTLSKDEFMAAHMKESVDTFLTGQDFANQGLVGDDFIPLLGGPYNKQLYYYDYLRMHATAFHAYHHDPFARRIINIERDFTLGRGWRADTVGADKDQARALWRAFEQVNNLYDLIDYACVELGIYGEIMAWELPNGQQYVEYDLDAGQDLPSVLLPRYTLIDPSVIWDIITYPEDIRRVLAYQWVAPTQYQIYTSTPDEKVTSTKFIYQQVPADQVIHVKANCVSNEKRGRSDLFPVLGYLKRLRDSVNWSLVRDQKNAAWSIDTTIEGSQSDIDSYVDSQQQLGTIPPAGSEFVHTAKVKRDYLSAQGGGAHGSVTFDWCLSMIAAGTGIPVNYFGTHLSGGQTRASALVATEPVTKLFEKKQQKLEYLLKQMAKRLFKKFGLDADIEVTFPELVTQDRSAKLKDLALAEQMQWLARETVAELAAKEFNITEYDYQTEKEKMDTEGPVPMGGQMPGQGSPLTAPPRQPNPSAVTGAERKQIADNN